ncbi:MAG: four helix bundle protein [Betaproteobacteria bacterium]
MQDFRNLVVWQHARRLLGEVYELTAGYPNSEELGLKLQMRRAGVSICTNIAEGCGRHGDREFRRFLDMAMGSACELECEIVLSHDLALIRQDTYERVVEAIVTIKRMLATLIARLRIRGTAGAARQEPSADRR